MRYGFIGICCILAVTLPSVSLAVGPFIDDGANRGIGAYEQAQPMGSGVAASDFDQDGDVDLFVPTVEGQPNQLYVNNGQGHFAESAASHGLADTARARAALWFDMDGDRDLDLLVGSDCFGEWVLEPGLTVCRADRPMQKLYRQEQGQFVDVTATSGLGQDSGGFRNDEHRGGYAAADVDGDGDLDLYAAIWFGQSTFYLNQGNGTFVDATMSAGMQTPTQLAQWQPVFADFNRDGAQDLFIAVDFAENLLFINDGDGAFVDHADAAGVATIWNEMGVALGDYDNDGDPDVYSTNVWERSPGEHNVLFRNDSAGGVAAFGNPAMELGVGNTSWGWGTTFFDADLDGDLDLAATNGFGSSDGPQYTTDRSCFFRNDGNVFVEMAAAVGLDDNFWGSSLIAADLDTDGRPDLVQTTKVHPTPGPLRLMMNQGIGDEGWLRIQPKMLSGNTQAIGAEVSVRTGSSWQTRFIHAGISFLGQEPAEALFGLGDSDRVDELVIRWPNGSISQRLGTPANSRLELWDDQMMEGGFE